MHFKKAHRNLECNDFVPNGILRARACSRLEVLLGHGSRFPLQLSEAVEREREGKAHKGHAPNRPVLEAPLSFTLPLWGRCFAFPCKEAKEWPDQKLLWKRPDNLVDGAFYGTFLFSPYAWQPPRIMAQSFGDSRLSHRWWQSVSSESVHGWNRDGAARLGLGLHSGHRPLPSSMRSGFWEDGIWQCVAWAGCRRPFSHGTHACSLDAWLGIGLFADTDLLFVDGKLASDYYQPYSYTDHEFTLPPGLLELTGNRSSAEKR